MGLIAQPICPLMVSTTSLAFEKSDTLEKHLRKAFFSTKRMSLPSACLEEVSLGP